VGALEKHSKYSDRVGNYTLLGQILNIKASNNPFRAKKKEYLKSNIQLTKEIAKDYKNFKYRQVENRSKKLAILAIKIWNLSNNKIK